MELEKNQVLNEMTLFFCVSAFSLIWMLSLTYNFSFFWEDNRIIAQYEESLKFPEKYTFLSLTKSFFTALYPSQQLYTISYLWRPIHENTYPILVWLFGINILQHRIAKTLLFSLLITIYLYFLLKPLRDTDDKNTRTLIRTQEHLLLILFIIGYLFVLPEFFIAVLYYQDLLIMTMFFATLPLFIFYFFYDEKKGSKIRGLLLFSVIILSTQISILLKHVGRINFILIVLFLLMTEKKKLLQPKYFLLIFALLFLSIPLLGLINIFSGESLYTIIGLSEQLGNKTGSFQILSGFIKTLHLSFIPHAQFLLLLLFVTAGMHICALTKKKGQVSSPNLTKSLERIVVWSGIWFLLEALSLFIARGFVIEKMFFLRFEFSIFIFPQVLFVISYAYFVYRTYFSNRKWVYYVLVLFLLLSFGHNVLRLNEWRGGWGGYFLGYDTARQYVDAHEKQAALLIKETHASPTYFLSNNTLAMIPELTNITTIHTFTQNYSSVFIAHTQLIDFKDNHMNNVANLTVKDTSPYGKIKKMLNRYYQNKIYLYKFEPTDTT